MFYKLIINSFSLSDKSSVMHLDCWVRPSYRGAVNYDRYREMIDWSIISVLIYGLVFSHCLCEQKTGNSTNKAQVRGFKALIGFVHLHQTCGVSLHPFYIWAGLRQSIKTSNFNCSSSDFTSNSFDSAKLYIAQTTFDRHRMIESLDVLLTISSVFSKAAFRF